MAYYSQIQFAVAVEISRCHGTRRASCAVVNCGLESAVTVAQQHRDVLPVRGDQVSFAVAVEVTHRYGNRIGSGVEHARRREAGRGTTVTQDWLVVKQTAQQDHRCHRTWIE